MRTNITCLEKLFYGLLLGFVWLMPGCRENTQNATIEDAELSKSGVRYVFYTRFKNNRAAQQGDLITFQLKVQNHLDSVLSNQVFQQYPFQEPYFISKEYYKDIFSMISIGDSLSFWINADSLTNKSGYLKTPKIAPGSLIKYTVKILDIQNKDDIRKKVEKDLKVQREEDRELIEKFIKEKLDSGIAIRNTPSGIYYYFEKEGNGSQPKEGDTVIINYTGKLLDGTIYSRSEETNEFPLGVLEPTGLDESIALMKSGGKGTFILPSELAYGPKGMGNIIPPNTVLVFDVELIEVK
ncbi:MAG: FKBP-type peptidyl-prolyl cis-trans isomerase [Microscillaceae bacterium]|nr:FKBP-type peptidyl-prolyl cis-trans isomerase [Microscillaceae bacterium]